MNLQANQHRKDYKCLEMRGVLVPWEVLIKCFQINVPPGTKITLAYRCFLLGQSKTHKASEALLYKHKVNSFNKYLWSIYCDFVDKGQERSYELTIYKQCTKKKKSRVINGKI